MKKILIFIDWYLPGNKSGGPLRSIMNMISHLNNHFEFYILTRNTDYCENIPYTEVESNAWNKIDRNTFAYYLSNDKITIRNLKKIVQHTDFDILYINGIYSFYFSILPVLLGRFFTKKPMIVAPRGMLSKGSVGVKIVRKKTFLVASQFIKFYKNVIFHATVHNELLDIERELKIKRNIHIITNLPAKVNETERKIIKKQRNQLRLVYISRISPEKNTKYAISVLNEVKDIEIQFDIYGPVYNTDYWNECLELIKISPKNVTINYLSSISTDKIFETLAKYHFLFLPSTGENFGHVILESFMAGCPVIISDRTPWRNLLQQKIGFDLPLENRQSFVETIRSCANLSQDEFSIWSENATVFGTKQTECQSIIDAYIKLFCQSDYHIKANSYQ